MRWFDRAPGAKRTFSLPRSRGRLDAELQEEFAFHLAERRDELIAAGMSPEQAEAEVQRRFGDFEAYRVATRRIDEDTLRQSARAEFWRTLARESRHAVRALTRQRAFTVVAFCTLALGIGATTAMYAVLDAVVLRPLPYADADRLVAVLHPAVVPGSGERHWGVSPGGYIHFARDTRTLEAFGIYRTYSFTVTSGGDAELARVANATHTMFDVLGARAVYGRLLNADDDAPGAPQTVVLSYEYHQRRFGGDPGVVGRNLETVFGSFPIIGVANPGLTLPMPGPFADASDLAGFGVDLWMAARIDAAGPFYNNHPNVGVGRLKPGVTAEAAQVEFATLLSRFPEQMPAAYSERFITNYNFRVRVAALRDAVLGPKVPRALWMLFGSVLLVLVIAAANVGNLFLVRMESRRREVAVRAALGADRVHLAAHHLAESLLLCGAAGLAAIGIAWATLKLLLRIAPTDVPRLHAVALTPQAALVAFGIAVVIGVVLGLVPLLRRDLDVGALRDGGRGMSGSVRQRAVRGALVVGQVALTLMLLAATGLMWRSFAALRQVQPGFSTERTLAFEVSLPFSAYDTREKAIVAYRQLAERLAALPGVEAVGGGPLPLQDFGTGCASVFREGRPAESGEKAACVPSPTALPGYFEAMGITVVGRTPTWSDLDARTQPAVITRALAERLWPGEDAIGKGLGNNGSDAVAFYRVVGVIPELRAESLDLPPTEAVFYPATSLEANQRTDAINDLALLVRVSRGDPLALMPQVRDAVRAIDANIPIIAPRTLVSVAARSMARTSFTLALLGFAGMLGLVLSAVGLYGVVSYLVQQRRGELGVRLALGATSRGVLRLVIGQSLRLGLVGVSLGLLGAFATNRALQALLFEVRAGDPVVLLGVAVLLVATVTLASWAPARRASRIEPVEAMRGGN